MINKVTRQKASHQVLAQLKEGISNGTFPRRGKTAVREPAGGGLWRQSGARA
jgi:hypothetical protein